MTSRTIYTPNFFKSLSIQLRVVYALIMRELITRFGRHGLGFAWLFLEPMVFTMGVAAMWSATKSVHGSNIPIIPFAIIGYSSVLCWRNAVSRSANAVEANTGLLYHRNVRVMDVFLARALLEIAGATTSFLMLSIISIMIGVMDFPKDFLLMASGWLLLIWFALGLSFFIGALFELSEIIDKFWHAITYLLFPLSGAAFFVEWLPENMRHYILYLPMVHATEMIRHGYYGDLVPTHENVAYLVWFNLILSLIGLLSVRYISNKIEASH